MSSIKKFTQFVIFSSMVLLFFVACQPMTTPLFIIGPSVTLTAPSAGAKLTENQLTITGRGNPGLELLILMDNRLVGSTRVGSNGAWSFETNLAEAGEHRLRVQVINANRVVIAQAGPISFSFRPAGEIVQPTLTLPGADGLTTGSLTLTGQGQPGTTVQILLNGQVAGVSQVDEAGAWSVNLNLAEPGKHTLTVRFLDAGGNLVAEAAPIAAFITSQAATTPALDIIFPADGADILPGQLSLIGPGEPGARVEILDNSTVLGEAVVSPEGEWSFTFEPSSGDHQFALRPGGDQTVPSRVVNVRVTDVDQTIDCNINPGLYRGDNYIVGTCDTLVEISEQLGLSYETLRAANPQIENPDLIYPGQILTIPQ
jgi:hypothetical protein